MRLRLLILTLAAAYSFLSSQERPRLRDLGVEVGIFKPGAFNAITDVEGVAVGHVTLVQGESVRTGVTVVQPHRGNMFRDKVPAAMYVGNGFGKLVGYSQVQELGQLETPIVLTNTLSVWDAANGLVDYMISLPENRDVRSINPVVGETNDGGLNDIRGRHVTREHVLQALENAASGRVEEGSVGAGTGTVAFGWKGGIGTSSRILPRSLGGFTIGVLVQTNYGGILEIAGVPIGRELGRYSFKEHVESNPDGSCMIVVATDAPLENRQLTRVARRAVLALGRSGSPMSHGSGDYVIAFSTAKDVRMSAQQELTLQVPRVREEILSGLFQAVVEATEEAIDNSLLKATSVKGHQGREVEAIPIADVVRLLKTYGKIR
ncbi:MAG: P1 family peptidase [Ignavibacteria bacterium]|nr:P1 family peptidase [Ignavibacteria bacterium]